MAEPRAHNPEDISHLDFEPEASEFLDELPMTEGTRTAIMDELAVAISHRDASENGDVQAEFALKDDEYEHLSLSWRTEASGEEWQPNEIGKVRLIPHEATKSDSMLMDRYTLIHTPDGVQLKKHTNDIGYATDAMRADDHVTTEAARHHINEAMEAEDRLGLSTVGETEAQRFLAVLRAPRTEEAL